MRNRDHRRAQELASQAQLAAAESRTPEALKLYAEAADCELRALRQVPEEKRRTWAVLAVSAASLLYKARSYERAETFLHSCLARTELLPFARHELRELLEVVFDEQALPQGFAYSGDEIMLALRGDDIGWGTAPIEMAVRKIADLRGLIARLAEFAGGFEFRRSGPPPAAVSAFMQTRATQPQSGSYRLTIRLVEPQQVDLFEPPRLRATQVATMCLEVARLSCTDTSMAKEQLSALVPHEGYRQALLRLTRNLLPSDKGLREVEIVRYTPSSNGPIQERVLLTREQRPALASKLRTNERMNDDSQEAVEYQGVLRALHLDQHWLDISVENGTLVRLNTRPDVLDDVVGPLVNRPVRARAFRRGSTGLPLLSDIEPIDQSDHAA